MPLLALLARLDRYLVDEICQKISDWVQVYTGKSCFWLAAVLLVPYPVLVVANGAARGLTPLDYLIVGATFVQTLRWWLSRDKNEATKTETSTLNPMRQFMPCGAIRTLVLLVWAGEVVVSVMLLYAAAVSQDTVYAALVLRGVVWQLLFFCWIISWYFAACTPKPKSPLRAGSKLAFSVN